MTPALFLNREMGLSDLRPDWALETACWQAGHRHVAGVDEAGRGAWAGPVVAAAVILPLPAAVSLPWLVDVNDSKQLTPGQRQRLRACILRDALAVGVGCGGVREIDEVGIAVATRRAMARAIAALDIPPDALLLDYVRLREVDLPQQSMPKGDTLSLSIAAASIIAKTTRDAMLRELDGEFPAYRFAQHKGYGTALHAQALERCGPCALHRQSFAPVARFAMLAGAA